MKRLWIFLGVGPLIGFICALFAGYAELLATPYILPVLVIYFYVAGAIPALLTCAVDHWLSEKVGVFKRAAATSLVGHISVTASVAAYYEQLSWEIASVGISGAIAGLICSLMASEKPKGAAFLVRTAGMSAFDPKPTWQPSSDPFQQRQLIRYDVRRVNPSAI